MVFNSLAFFIFIFLFILILPWIKKDNGKFLFISIASLIFYGYWEWSYIFLILISGLIDYVCGLYIWKKPQYKKPPLIISLLSNLGILFVFKYLEFFINSINELVLTFGLDLQLQYQVPEYFTILPIGISFYTFQSMSYTIDIYKGELKPTRNFLKFFSYLSMFPQLVAGPIVRARDVLAQLKDIKLERGDELYYAIKLIIYGFFKKTVIADGVAKYINIAFVNAEHPDSSLYWWSIAICFSIQIYCDFSGYSDIARGLARMFGIHFPLNFNHPYTAKSFKDFWGRWHISLSSWFRDYVYIPLGGSQKGRFLSHANMWATMIISGIWHGANYTFIVWGALHALYLSVERLTNYHKKVPQIISRLIVLFFVIIA